MFGFNNLTTSSSNDNGKEKHHHQQQQQQHHSMSDHSSYMFPPIVDSSSIQSHVSLDHHGSHSNQFSSETSPTASSTPPIYIIHPMNNIYKLQQQQQQQQTQTSNWSLDNSYLSNGMNSINLPFNHSNHSNNNNNSSSNSNNNSNSANSNSGNSSSNHSTPTSLPPTPVIGSVPQTTTPTFYNQPKPTYIRDDIIQTHSSPHSHLIPLNSTLGSNSIPMKKRRYVIDQNNVFHWQPYCKNYWNKLHSVYGEIQPPLLSILVEKGFVYSDIDKSWVHYRRNHFQLGISIQHHFIFDETSPPMIHVNGSLCPIESLFLTIRGIKSPSAGNPESELNVELYQTNSKREKSEEKVPPPIQVTYTSSVTIPRLHFRKATSNNARKNKLPNPQQEFFCLIVKISARCQDKEYLVTSLISDPLIVRTGHPTNTTGTGPLSSSSNSTPTSGSSSGALLQQYAGSSNSSVHSSPLSEGMSSSSGHLDQKYLYLKGSSDYDGSSPSPFTFFNQPGTPSANTPASSTTPSLLAVPSNPSSSTTSPSINYSSPNLLSLNTNNTNNSSGASNSISNINNLTTTTTTTTTIPMTASIGSNNNNNNNNNGNNSTPSKSINKKRQLSEIEDDYSNSNNSSDYSLLPPIINPLSSPSDSNSQHQQPQQQQVQQQQQQQHIELASSSPPHSPFPIQSISPKVIRKNNNSSTDSNMTNATTTTSTTSTTAQDSKENANGWTSNQNNTVYHYGNVGINSENPQEALSVDGNLFCTGFLYQPSDKRVKTNIQEVKSKDQLKNIMKVKIYDYEYADDWADSHGIQRSTKDRGVLAQELRETNIPGAVKETGDKQMASGTIVKDFLVVNKDTLFMENVGATQELSHKVDNVCIELERLDKLKIQDLGKKVGELEKKTIREIQKNRKRKKMFIIAGIFILLLILSLVALSVVLGTARPKTIIESPPIPNPNHLSDSCESSMDCTADSSSVSTQTQTPTATQNVSSTSTDVASSSSLSI